MIQTRNSFSVKLLLSTIFFIACLINTLLEIYREVVIITKQVPSSLYFIKLFFSLPVILFAMSLIQKALNKYSFLTIFNVINLSFCAIFICIGCLIPFEDKLQKGQIWTLDIFCDAKMSLKGLSGLLPLYFMFCEWISTFSYIVSELWSSVMIGYALYTLSNYVCNENEMKEIVPYFSSITAVSMIISAILYGVKDSLEKAVPEFINTHSSSIFFITLFCCTLLIYFLKNTVISYAETKSEMKKNLKDSTTIGSLLQSKFLQNMCIVAMLYAINAGYIDMSFKNALSAGSKITNTPPRDYSKKFIITLLCVISGTILTYNTMANRFFRTKGILFPSIVSPISASIFAISISCLAFYNIKMNSPKINLENWIGAIGLGFSKITKYVLFDLAKEMISMRVPLKYRYKYKSVYDGICIKLGKSVVSFYGAFLTFLGFTDIRHVSLFTLLILIIGNIFWIRSVFYLNDKYQKSVDQNCDIDVEN